jgi:hypothetical protein
MATKKISELDPAAVLDGTELVEIVQDGANVQTTTQDIADLGGGSAGPAPSTTQTGTSYTLDLYDANTYVRLDNAAAIVLTIPPNSAVAFPVDTVISFEQTGAGIVTVTPGSGVTVNSRGGALVSAGQYAVFQVKKVATDVWTLLGDVA